MEAAQAFFDGRYGAVVDDDDEMEDLSMARSTRRASGLEVLWSINTVSCRSPTNLSYIRHLLMVAKKAAIQTSRMTEMPTTSWTTIQTRPSKRNPQVAQDRVSTLMLVGVSHISSNKTCLLSIPLRNLLF
jgi:hypothetical protein